eukprot:TRINITY_DN50165_c0_g1_i1.p1 TRINITY_DN50165_c0_g1~~TRINITY_DN50165_c0_g1_i1.p1  ORF type:complete len:317 (-),score=67.31 TRINITY_DN50165_c0_g1_i1:30-980(-)
MGRSQDDVFLEDSVVEPDLALKIGPFSCFCVCVPRNPKRSKDDFSGNVKLASPAAPEIEFRRRESRRRLSSGSNADAVVARRSSSVLGGSSQAMRSTASRSKSGLLGPVVAYFEAALVPSGSGSAASDLRRAPLIDAIEAFAAVLDQIAPGAGMGDHLTLNTKKLRDSQADASHELYKAWMLSELPVHGPGFSGYADNSAWMGNLWMSWTLQFFVEFFALLDEGQDTRASADGAYKETLYNHHNFLQRGGFNAAVRRLPSRQDMYKLLQGDIDADGVEREVGLFVKVARPAVRLCLEVNDMVSERMKEEKRKQGGW